MLKKQQSNISTNSTINSLKFSTFNYFGMGAVLASVTEAFWINFSAYYLNNILPSHGNLIFLIAQIFEGVGILFGWFILAKLGNRPVCQQNESIGLMKKIIQSCLRGTNLYMLVYIVGTFLLISCLPMVFLLPLADPKYVFAFAIMAKIGSGMMIISQLTIIPKITLNRSRRRKLVQKVTQYGLAGTFISMFFMTIVSVYVNFVWKYFIGIIIVVFIGVICSTFYVLNIRKLVMNSCAQVRFQCKQKVKKVSQQIQNSQIINSNNIVDYSLLKNLNFYLYAIILILCTLYMDVVVAIYPYFIKSFHNTTHFRYLSAITALYMSAFVCSLITKNTFVFSGIRSVMTIGFISCALATILMVIGLIDRQFDALMIIGTCLTGISKVIASNCALNLVNQLVGKNVKGKQFIHGFYCFFERLVTGFVLYVLISKVYISEDDQFLHFSEIYLPFIFYAIAWIIVMVQRSLNEKLNKTNQIVIMQNKSQKNKFEKQFQDKQNYGV